MYSVALMTAEEFDNRNMLRIHRRRLRDKTDPFTMPEQRFRELYRFSREAALKLMEEMSPYMRKGMRTTFIPQPLRMCAALHFFSSGSCQRDIGQDFSASVSRSIVCRCVQEVADILETKLMPKYIKFPTPEEYDSIKQRFYEKTGFPGVIGAIDCTHVQITRPKAAVERCYLNRKLYHSKNVQLICDYDLKILGGFARFGGASHDSYIWEASRINVLLQERHELNNSHSWLLGDSGYPLRPWLITPYRSTSNVDERRFNTIHAQTRNCVERLNGVLKAVFRCLQNKLRVTTPQAAGKIINACTVLHNFRLAHGITNDDVIEDNQNGNFNTGGDQLDEPLREATRLRDRLKERLCRRY